MMMPLSMAWLREKMNASRLPGAISGSFLGCSKSSSAICKSSAIRYGLYAKRVAPRRIAFWLTSSSGDADNMIIGSSRYFGERRRRTISSSPSIRGIRISIKTSAVSGFRCRKANASTPSAAS